MSTILTGDAANITTPLSRSVFLVSDNGSGAVQITTSAAHLFGDGDRVLIAGVTGTVASAANGLWAIDVTGSLTFDLVGSTYSGSYSGAGTATDLSLTPQIQVASDGDQAAMNAAMLSALQGLMDRTQYLAKHVAPGGYNLVALYTFGATGTPATNLWGGGNWEANSSFVSGSSQVLGAITGPTVVGDVLDLSLTSTWRLNTNAATAYDAELRLELGENAFTPAGVVGARQLVQFATTAAATAYSGTIAMIGTKTIANAGTATLNINGLVSTGAATFFRGADSWSATVRHWRPN